MKQILFKIFILSTLLNSLSGYSQEIITLERALDIASKNSPDLEQSKLSLTQSQEKLTAQRARLKSQFSLSLNPFEYQKSNQFSQQSSEWYLNESASTGGTFSIEQRILPTDGTLSLQNQFSYDYNFTESELAGDPYSRTFNNDLTISLSQPLFTYNTTKVELETLELNYESALLEYLLQRLELEKNVAQYFYQVYSQQMQLNISQEELKNNEESYQIISNKVEGGLLAKEELYQAEVNLATSRSSVFNAEISLQNYLDQLKVLIGMPLKDTITILAEVETSDVWVDLNRATELALTNRMELRQKEISIENSMFDLIEAKSTNEFEGAIEASFGMQSNDEDINALFDKSTRSPSVGLTLEIPLFDWGERKATIRAAEASLKSSEIDLEKEKVDIEVNIRSVVRSLENYKNQIEIQRKTVDNADLTYKINLEKYLNGDLTSMNLGEYQTQLSDAKMDLTNAIIDYKLELLNLKIQTLYDFENQVSVIPKDVLEVKGTKKKRKRRKSEQDEEQ